VPRISHTHVAIVDALIADPFLCTALPRALNTRPVGYSKFCPARTFKSCLAARRGQLMDPTLRATFEQQMDDRDSRARRLPAEIATFSVQEAEPPSLC
jgi:hypothetical protein